MLLALFVVAACVSRVDNRGHVRTDEALSRIQEGASNKGDVVNALGSPSSKSDFGNEIWYYISARKETVGFLAPEVADQQVVSIEFDGEGMVRKINRHDKSGAKDIKAVSRTTPTEGHQLGFVEQVLGNVGRFNKKGDEGSKTSAPAPRRPGGY